jgi:CHAT domain-containing protein
VPDKTLFSLPFPALRSSSDSKEEAWLAASYTTNILPSLSFLKANTKERPRQYAKTFLGVGNPLLAPSKRQNDTSLALRSALLSDQYFDPDKLRALASLPDTETELMTISQNWAPARSSLLLGKDASETALQTIKLSDYQYISFATHALLASELSDRSEPGLVLTPPNSSTKQNDGVLTTSEIMSRPLNAEWVVLSACNTAGFKHSSHENFMALAGGFFFAGAKALLVSGWNVDSQSAAILTTQAFKALQDTSRTKAQALRQAMIEMMRGDYGKPYQHPFHWAPFFTVGY